MGPGVKILSRLARVFFSFAVIWVLLSAYRALTLSGVYSGAGIIPFSTTPDGQVVVLLGIDSHTLRWADFGGRRESGETNPAFTACREFLEETASLSRLTMQECTSRIMNDTSTRNIVNESPNGARFISFLLDIDYEEDLPSRFDTLIRDITEKRVEAPPHLEKFTMEWIPVKELLASLEMCCERESDSDSCTIGTSRKARPAVVRSFCIGHKSNYFTDYI